ncbi:MAG: D-aminoacyl-tRNA deacylase [Nitrospinota bacterium]
MRAVVQRVSRCSVRVAGERAGEIGPGLLVLLGAGAGDAEEDARALAEKTANLRIFPDGEGKLNLSLLDTGGAMLVVSQFTLLGDCRRGRRPSFAGAAPAALAERLYERFAEEVSRLGVPTARGRFGALMEVELVNDGPVTLLLDSGGAF